LVGDLAGKLANMEIRSSKAKRMNMILVPPRIPAASTVVISPDRHHSQESVNIQNLHQQEETKGKRDELSTAIVSPEKVT
jgi:hypothetical protein